MSGPYDQQMHGGQVGAQYATYGVGQVGVPIANQYGGHHHRRRNASTSSSSSSDRGRVFSGQVGGSYSYGGDAGYTQVGAGSFGYGGQRRGGRYQRQVCRLPDAPAGPPRQICRRLPTPEPDTIERIYIQRAANEVIEEITEIPTTPPPRIQERTVVEPTGPPRVVRRTVRVPPRSHGYHQQSGGFISGGGGLTGAKSYGCVPDAVGVRPSISSSGFAPSIGGGGGFAPSIGGVGECVGVGSGGGFAPSIGGGGFAPSIGGGGFAPSIGGGGFAPSIGGGGFAPSIGGGGFAPSIGGGGFAPSIGGGGFAPSIGGGGFAPSIGGGGFAPSIGGGGFAPSFDMGGAGIGATGGLASMPGAFCFYV